MKSPTSLCVIPEVIKGLPGSLQRGSHPVWGNLAPPSLFSTCIRICELTIYPRYMVLGIEPLVDFIQSMTLDLCNVSPVHTTPVSQFMKTLFYLYLAVFFCISFEISSWYCIKLAHSLCFLFIIYIIFCNL